MYTFLLLLWRIELSKNDSSKLCRFFSLFLFFFSFLLSVLRAILREARLTSLSKSSFNEIEKNRRNCHRERTMHFAFDIGHRYKCAIVNFIVEGNTWAFHRFVKRNLFPQRYWKRWTFKIISQKLLMALAQKTELYVRVWYNFITLFDVAYCRVIIKYELLFHLYFIF